MANHLHAKQLMKRHIPHLNIALGHYADQAGVVHKFGRNDAVDTTLSPVTLGGIYRTPQVGGATALRVKAGDANDTAAGLGAREITIIGMNASGAEVSETLATAGTSPSANSTNLFIRLYRIFVSASGTYATQAAGSHAAEIVIENSAGTEDWGSIDATVFPNGQSEIAVYTVPAGKAAYIQNIKIQIETNKTMDIVLFQRGGVLDTAPPYSAMRAVNFFASLEAPYNIQPDTPFGPFHEFTDIGFMAQVPVGSGKCSVDFELLVFNEV